MSKAGRISITVWGPYPCWCNIEDDQGNTIRIAHTELSDLLYATQKAMQEARLKLKRSGNDDEV